MLCVNGHRKAVPHCTELKFVITVISLLVGVQWVVNQVSALPVPKEQKFHGVDQFLRESRDVRTEPRFKSARTKRSLFAMVPALNKCSDGLTMVEDGSKGYKCVKRIRINHEAYMEFLTKYLNSLYGPKGEQEVRRDLKSENTIKDESLKKPRQRIKKRFLVPTLSPNAIDETV